MRIHRKTSIAFLLVCATSLGASTLGGRECPFPDLPGWTLTIDSTVYTPRNLYDFIDGAAEVFVSYDFVDLTIGDYVGEDSLHIRAEAYRHTTPTMAFGIYASERKPDYHFVKIGTEGYQEEGVLNFLSGEYYLKLSTHSAGERGGRALRSIAERVAAHLDRPRRWPPELRHLPEAGGWLNTEGYIARDFLGYSFLRNVFTAQYGEGAGFLLFVIEPGTGLGAEEILGRYSAVAGSPERRNGGYRFADPNNGPVTLAPRDDLLFGIVNAPSDSVEARYISLFPPRAR